MLNDALIALKYILTYGLTSAFFGIILSPIQFLKVIKQQQNNLSYIEIFSVYKKEHTAKVFFRGAVPYAIMQFISSAAFGLSEFIVNTFILNDLTVLMIYEILLRSLLGSILETAITIKFEVLEISKNKKEFITGKATIFQILSAILIRNSIFWIGAVLAYKISEQLYLNYALSLFVGLLLGIIFSLISMPFDVIATQNCGTHGEIGIKARIKEIIFHSGIWGTCSGMLMRIIQIAIYTAITAIVAKFL